MSTIPAVWPLVAIATPVYNGERFLAETMACVQAQTYPNLVHCILDNASTDETASIIDRFRDGRVPLIVHRNAETIPMTDNWNAALDLVPASALYFRILPADDLMLPTAIEKMVSRGEEFPEVDIIGCQEWVNDRVLGAELPPERRVFSGKSILRASLCNEIHGFPHLHCLYRKPAGAIAPGFYVSEYHGTRLLAIDMDAAMRALASSFYGYVHEPLVITRLHEDSVTSREVTPNHIKMWSELQLIDRWGPAAFGSPAGYMQCRRRHLRFYYRYLLLWRGRKRTALLNQHLERLRMADALPSPVDYLAAVAEWPLLKAGRMWRDVAIKLGLRSQIYQDV